MLITGTKEGKTEAWNPRAHVSIGVLVSTFNSVDTNIAYKHEFFFFFN